ncbi:MAG: type VI secretion system contractile sheath domain-containing protein [Terriglobia bacterium]
MIESRSTFVIGVLADLSGMPSAALPRLRQRRFVTVTRESFAQFLARKRPRLTPTVQCAEANGGFRKLELSFANFEDFQSEGVARKLEELNTLDPCSAMEVSQIIVRMESFCMLQGAWAGLKFLVDSVAGNSNVKVRVLDVSQRELLRDIQRAPEFDQSALFRLVFSQEIGTFGGEAFGCILGDYYLTPSAECAELARDVSKVAAAAGAPFFCGIQSGLVYPFGWEPGALAPACPGEEPLPNPWWKRGEDCQQGWALFLLMPKVRQAPAAPLSSVRLGSVIPPGRLAESWFNPGYFVARTVADAFSDASLPEIAEKLFPEWSKARDTPSAEPDGASCGRGTELPLTSGVRLEALGAEFARDIPLEIRDRLSESGLNVLSESTLKRRDFLRSLKPIAPFDPWFHQASLAQVLLGCTVMNRLRQYLRLKRRSGNAGELWRTAEPWLKALNVERLTGRRLLPLQQISVTTDGCGLSVSMTFLSSVCPAGCPDHFTFRIHRRAYALVT